MCGVRIQPVEPGPRRREQVVYRPSIAHPIHLRVDDCAVEVKSGDLVFGDGRA